MMDLARIREDLAAVATAAGFNSWDYEPDDPQTLPACIIGGIREMERLNAIVTRAQILVTFYCSVADPKDATRRLDLALSVGHPNSFIDMLDSVTLEDGPAWRSIRFESASRYRRFAMPGGHVALGVEIVLELTA
jgi:hypothetical protein